MAVQKLYAGVKLREIRQKIGLSQKEFAAKLGVSLPYLNQMENNHRPVSTTVVLALAQEFGFDVTELTSGDSERVVSDMREAFADPVFTDFAPSMADIRLTASNAPGVARAFLALHQAYRQSHERLASMDEALGRAGHQTRPGAWEEVRDFFHYCDNYIDAVDRAAENFAKNHPNAVQGAADLLHAQGITITRSPMTALRRYDKAQKVLELSATATPATAGFQTLLQLALLNYDDLLEATLDLARFSTDEARMIAKIGLANYFAGAALMPYGRFLARARALRHDLQRLEAEFGCSLEQICHRLSTLQRPGAKGIPFFFVRVDQAGTITKRHSATRLQFARYGGACPLWNVHRAFETPGRFLLQLAQTPDGVRYISIARDVSKSGGYFGAPVQRYAIAIGCDVAHAGDLVYADTLDINNAKAYEPIGISCRICERRDCHQRSVPPLERPLHIDPDKRDVLPYDVGG